MSGRFFGGNKPRKFNNRRLLVVKKKSNNKKKMNRNSRVRSTNVRVRGERVETFRVYVGSVGSSGIQVPVGPSKVYNNTQYFMSALNYNNYRPLSVSLEYTPLVNQTQAQSMINAYLTTDVAVKIPADDVAMKNSTTSHFGSEWFAAYRRQVRFRIPPLKQNTYETGSGDVNGNTAYEDSCFIICKPTGYPTGDSAPKTVGELYMVVRVALSSPATPIPVASVVDHHDFAFDESISIDNTTLPTLVIGAAASQTDYYLYLNAQKMHDKDAVPFLINDLAKQYSSGKTGGFLGASDITEILKLALNGKDNTENWASFTSGTVYFKSKSPYDTNANYVSVAITYDADSKHTYTRNIVPTKTVNVRLINNVVPVAESDVFDSVMRVLSTLKSSSIPIHNKNVEGDTDIMDTNVLNNVQIHNKNVEDDTDDMSVKVTNNVQTHNKFVEDDTDVAIVHVDNDADSPAHVAIEGQPIEVKQQKDSSDEVMDILKLMEELAFLV